MTWTGGLGSWIAKADNRSMEGIQMHIYSQNGRMDQLAYHLFPSTATI